MNILRFNKKWKRKTQSWSVGGESRRALEYFRHRTQGLSTGPGAQGFLSFLPASEDIKPKYSTILLPLQYMSFLSSAVEVEYGNLRRPHSKA